MADMEVPRYQDDETTLAQLKQRIARTVDFIRSVPAARIDGTEDKVVEPPVTSTAYNLLRRSGVPVGKRDFLGHT